MSDAKAIVVSAYGRGHWLAVALQRLGLEVVLMDVSETLGSWVTEESEGPFGLFQNEDLDPSQWERLIEDDEPMALVNGWTLWLGNGPLEFKGPTMNHRLRQLQISEQVQNYLQGRVSSGEAKRLLAKPFREVWLAQLAHLWSANDDWPNVRGLESPFFTPIFARFLIRLASRPGHMRSLDWCRRQGVTVMEKAKVVDVSLRDRRQVRGLEVQSEQSEMTQVMELDQLVWCLSSEETQGLSPRLMEKLFPHGALEPLWFWARYRLRLSEGLVRDNLPQHVVILRDVDQPWTHQNLVNLQRTGSPDLFDAWIKLPHVQRFNKAYLQDRGSELVSSLRLRLTNLNVEIANLPLGADLTAAQVGPARQPVYDIEARAAWKKSNYDNVWFESVEERAALGWNAQFVSERQLMKKLEAWWIKLQEKKNKERARIAAANNKKNQHPPRS